MVNPKNSSTTNRTNQIQQHNEEDDQETQNTKKIKTRPDKLQYTPQIIHTKMKTRWKEMINDIYKLKLSPSFQ